MEKENQRVMLTKRLLKEGLLRLLKKKEMSKITVCELCQESGINRATFYRHYQVPQDVLRELERELVAEIRKMVRRPDTLDEARAYFLELFTYMYERAELLKVMIRSDSMEDFNQLLLGIYMDILEKSDFSFVKELDQDSIRLLSSYFCGGGYFLMRCWLTEDISKTPEEVVELLLGFLENGPAPLQ